MESLRKTVGKKAIGENERFLYGDNWGQVEAAEMNMLSFGCATVTRVVGISTEETGPKQVVTAEFGSGSRRLSASGQCA